MRKLKRVMKRNFKILAVVLLMAAAACSFTTKTFSDPNKDKLLIDLITYVLNQGHYDAKDINDSFSEKVYDNYLENLDGAKRFFYKKDVEEFSAYRDKIDDQIEEKQIEFFDLTYNRLIERANEAKALYKDILAEPFDFAENEEINTDYDKLDFPANKEEMRDRWKKQLKFNTLINYYDLKQDEQTKKKPILLIMS